MQKKLLVAVLGTLFAIPAFAEDAPAAAAAAPAASPVTANVGIVSDYVWRGISQTSHAPAIQGGFDYAHSSGFYAGLWGSNVSWIVDTATTTAGGSASLEMDTYFGFKGNASESVSYDVGFIRYNYPGTYDSAASTGVANTYLAKADTNEAYLGIGYKWFTLKYSYALGQFLTLPDAAGTNYIDLSAAYPIADSGFTLAAHVGKQTYKGANAAGLEAITTGVPGTGTPTYTDYKLAVTKDFSGYVLGLTYTNTNASSFYTTSNTGSAFGKLLGSSATALSLTHAF
jgi:uncharacterized protein (TIGR02001 family)